MPHGVYDMSQYKEQTRVFQDRQQVLKVLAGMLHTYQQDIQLVLGIPSGGVPVGVAITEIGGIELNYLCLG